MEIQQNLKAVWKNLENIMTIDEEMKELSVKAAKANRKQEKCGNNTRFAIVFFKSSLAAMEGPTRGKWCQDAFTTAHERAEHSVF